MARAHRLLRHRRARQLVPLSLRLPDVLVELLGPLLLVLEDLLRRVRIHVARAAPEHLFRRETALAVARSGSVLQLKLLAEELGNLRILHQLLQLIKADVLAALRAARVGDRWRDGVRNLLLLLVCGLERHLRLAQRRLLLFCCDLPAMHLV